jgi:hypothetical protein
MEQQRPMACHHLVHCITISKQSKRYNLGVKGLMLSLRVPPLIMQYDLTWHCDKR